MKREKANYLIQSVSHALDVLEELSALGREVGVTELAKRLKLHKNNVFRLLATLQLRGYVDQNMQTEDYALGVRCLQLGQSFAEQSSLRDKAMPILKELSELTGETCSLGVLRNGQVHFPVSIASRRPVRVAARGGISLGGKESVSGRLLMAHLPDATLAELLAGNTTHDAAIKSQMNELRRTGTLVDRGGVEADVVTIAKVVRGMGDEVIGVIEIVAPQYRTKPEAIMEQVEEAVTTLSTALGSSGKVSLVKSIQKEVAGSETRTAS